ncbi:MAG: MFS transporter [Rhodospirillales bacterium]|nr:MFS transporter [Rhodospirillales bacterium]
MAEFAKPPEPSNQAPARPASTRARVSWALYDWANSAHPTLITTFVFAAYFTQGVAVDPISGTAQWGYAMSAAALSVAILSPIVGAIADNSGRRKPWLGVATVCAVLATAALWFVRPSPEHAAFALVGVALGIFFFELGQVFYNAMLPALVPGRMIGRMSGWAWGLGYAGGLSALVVALFGFVRVEGSWFGVGPEDAANVRAVAPLAAAWFALFALPLFFFTPDSARTGLSLGAATGAGLAQLAATARKVRGFRPLVVFLLAMMCASNGLTTLFAFGGIYAAATFGFDFEELLLFGIAMNVTAGLGAAAFGWLDDAIGPRRTLLIAIAGLFVLGAAILLAGTKAAFWVAALPLGLFVGPAQAAGRSYMAHAAPPAMRAEMFGLYALAGKATNFLGPAVLAVVTEAFASQRAGMASILGFFVAGWVLLLFVPDPRGTDRGAS